MDWESGPPVLVGEKVFWLGNAPKKPVSGIVKWIGNIPEISSEWCVGIELDEAFPGAECNGFWKTRKLFECRSKRGLITPLEEIQKICSKNKCNSTNSENNSRLHLDDSQLRDSKHSDLGGKSARETHRKNRNSYSEYFAKRTSDPKRERQTDRKSAAEPSAEALDGQSISKRIRQNVKASLQKEKSERKSSEKLERSSATPKPLADRNTNENLANSQTLDINTYLEEVLKNMNDVAGYFKEIKEGDERLENHNKMDELVLYGTPDASEPGQSKPKKLFSFLKWFNKKHKHEPNLKLFKDSSATSSPMFPRKETSSCESIDTLFSTQTVRSFAYIPPTQYVPSAPPLELEKSFYENVSEDDSSRKDKSEETESIYEKRKKRKAPEPPRLSRENSLPTTLEHKKNEKEEDFDGVKTYHRRTVSESFKDKKAGAYCHVQGKRKAPPPPGSPLYPNLQKLDSQYPSLYKKKKPAPPPPETHAKTQNPPELHQTRKDAQVKKDECVEKEKFKGSKDNESDGKEEMGAKTSQTSKARLSKDSSLSPLPSRPWYKRSHRDSTGSNIIRKDLLKGFDKKKNKESDDWMPEVGFSRRSLSTESGHNKFNIFSKLEKTEDKKKEEKRKSQISILTNISELDREAAEIVRKEQAEEKKMMAANDAKYYSPKADEKAKYLDQPATKMEHHNEYKDSSVKSELVRDEQNEKSNEKNSNGISKAEAIFDGSGEVKAFKNQTLREEQRQIKEKADDQLNGGDHLKEHPKQNFFTPIQLPAEKAVQPTPSRLNYFNVENKSLNYLNEPWVCKKCTLENPGWRVFCEICNSVKPRFLFNNVPHKADAPKSENFQRDTQKVEKVVEKAEESIKEKIPEKENNLTSKIEDEKRETLDDLRKKRMTFFSSKLETLPEQEKTGQGSFLNNSNEMAPTATSAGSSKQLEGGLTERATAAGDTAVPKEKSKARSSPEVINVQKKNQKPDAISTQQNVHSDPSIGPLNSSQPPAEKVIEAYIVTKRIVLEDVIVKKPERGRKVSTSVQTRSKPSASPEASKAISPPPRTKKIASDAAVEKKKEPEAELFPGKEFQRNRKEEELEELTNRLTQAQGLADFRANIETMPPNTEMNTVAVNRLLRNLETAINRGDHFVAGGLAKELALMKINCSVTRQSTPSPSTSNIILDLYIEDKVSHRGPIPLQVSPAMSVLQLKNKVQQELGIPLEVQRWILGKKLATDDSKTLEAEGVRSSPCSVFLYLVAPGSRKTSNEVITQIEKPSEDTIQNSKPKPETFSDTKGLYYNYEEDRYSYCEDSEEEQKSSSPESNGKTKVINTTPQNLLSAGTKNTDEGAETKKIGNHSSIVDLKSRETGNDIEKELKLISANSVRQKVEQLNRTFAENSRAVKPPLRSSRSPETWKCGACHFVNSPGKLNCSSCNVKKVLSGPYNRSFEDGKESPTKEPLKKENQKLASNEKNNDNIHYKALMELQDADLVPNSEPFNCSICLVDYAPAEGVTLKDCLHTFCRPCLVSTVQFSEDAEVKCPYLDETYSCPSVLQQREIKALVPQGIFELHLAKSVKEAENKIDNAFHCKTPDCKGWCIYEDNVNEFRCPVCKVSNCLTCQAVHTGINCREFQERMKVASETDVDAKKTTDMLNEMVEKGEAMACPKCQVVLMKKWGCDWLKCSMCKTEICWVTRGFRWGPEGKGDTSGGCKCGVNGVKCHPKCNYCH